METIIDAMLVRVDLRLNTVGRNLLAENSLESAAHFFWVDLHYF